MCKLTDAVNRTLGWPFKDRGRGPSGIDCLGLIIYLAREGLGITIGDLEYLDCRSGVDTIRYLEEYHRQARPVPLDSVKPGDVLLFSTHPDRRVSHVGMALGFSRFVHAVEDVGVRTARLYDAPWRQRLVGACRLKGEQSQ